MNSFKEGDFLNVEDLKAINKDILDLNTELIKIVEKEDYEEIIFNEDDLLYLEDIDKIEKSIHELGLNFFQPNGWILSKDWIKDKKILNRMISNTDINRWIYNLSLLKNHIEDDIELYNGFINHYEWNNDLSLEWSEN